MNHGCRRCRTAERPKSPKGQGRRRGKVAEGAESPNVQSRRRCRVAVGATSPKVQHRRRCNVAEGAKSPKGRKVAEGAEEPKVQSQTKCRGRRRKRVVKRADLFVRAKKPNHKLVIWQSGLIWHLVWLKILRLSNISTMKL